MVLYFRDRWHWLEDCPAWDPQVEMTGAITAVQGQTYRVLDHWVVFSYEMFLVLQFLGGGGGGGNHCSCSVSWCSASHEVFCACKESTGLFQQNAIKAHLSFQMLYLWQKRRENIEMFSERSSMVNGFYRRISQKLTGTHTDRSFH